MKIRCSLPCARLLRLLDGLHKGLRLALYEILAGILKLLLIDAAHIAAWRQRGIEELLLQVVLVVPIAIGIGLRQ